jgi:hypothetical protein
MKFTLEDMFRGTEYSIAVEAGGASGDSTQNSITIESLSGSHFEGQVDDNEVTFSWPGVWERGALIRAFRFAADILEKQGVEEL